MRAWPRGSPWFWPGRAWRAGSDNSLESNPSRTFSASPKTNPIRSIAASATPWRGAICISFAILNLAGLIYALATGAWRLRQIYDAAYFPLAGAVILCGLLGWLPRVKASTKGEGNGAALLLRHGVGGVRGATSAGAAVENPAPNARGECRQASRLRGDSRRNGLSGASGSVAANAPDRPRRMGDFRLMRDPEYATRNPARFLRRFRGAERRVPGLGRRLPDASSHLRRGCSRRSGLCREAARAGHRQGQKIVFWSENRPEWVAALWGCLLEGVIAVPIDFRNSADFVTRIAGIVEARAILTGDSVPEAPLCAALKRRFDRGREGAAVEASAWRFADFEWPAQEPAPSAPVDIRSDDIAQIVFTSGATAEPKGVIITHRNLLANIVPVENEIKKYRRYERPFHPVRFLNLLPLSHLFGQTLATFIPPMLAATVVFQQSYHPEEILRQIHSRRVSVLVSVPKILEVLRDYILHEFPESRSEPSRIEPSRSEPSKDHRPEKPAQGPFGPPDGQEPDGSPPSQARSRGQAPKEMHWTLRWWRFRRVHRAFGWKFWAFITGAAPLDPAVEEFFLRLGFLVIQGYGLTETAPIVTLNHPFHTRRGSVGTPVGGVEIRLADDGEVLVRGGNVSRGYFGQAEGESLDDGWLRTGDIGEMDAEGRLIDSRTQEGNDRAPGWPQGFPGRRGSRAANDSRRARLAPSSDRIRCMPCW